MRRGHLIGNIFCPVIFSSISVLGLTGCGGDSGPTPGSLAITTTSLPEGEINQPYSASLSGSGGALPYTWSVSPALPANLSLDTATGAITGTPTDAGNHDTHLYAARQLGPFANRPTNAQHNDPSGPDRAGNYHHFVP